MLPNLLNQVREDVGISHNNLLHSVSRNVNLTERRAFITAVANYVKHHPWESVPSLRTLHRVYMEETKSGGGNRGTETK